MMSDFDPGGVRRRTWQCLHPWKSLGRISRRYNSPTYLKLSLRNYNFKNYNQAQYLSSVASIFLQQDGKQRT